MNTYLISLMVREILIILTKLVNLTFNKAKFNNIFNYILNYGKNKTQNYF